MHNATEPCRLRGLRSAIPISMDPADNEQRIFKYLQDQHVAIVSDRVIPRDAGPRLIR